MSSVLSENKFAIIGGDLRQIHMAQHLLDEGISVVPVGFNKENTPLGGLKDYAITSQEIYECNIVVLPLPVSVDDENLNCTFSTNQISLEQVINVIPSNALVLGGKVSKKTREIFNNNNIDIIDYFEREELTVLNAIPTAEGALQIAMEETATTIHGSKCLVTGYGRISKVLTSLLKAFGAEVYVAARKYADLAWANVYGCKAIYIKDIINYANEFDIVFNTVPATILGEEILSKLKQDALVIDLASKPGGVEFETARKLNIKTIWALSLPGKVAPVTAGEILKRTIINIIEERRTYDE